MAEETVLTPAQESTPPGGQTTTPNPTGGENPPPEGGNNGDGKVSGSTHLENKTDWREFVPEDKREALKDVKDLNEVVESYLNRPTVPEEYKLPEQFPHKDIAEVAKGAGFTQQQLDAVIDYQTKKEAEFNKQVKTTQTKVLQEYKDAKGEKWDSVASLANQALHHFDEKGEMGKFLKLTGAGNSPIVIEFMYRIGKILKEDGYLKSEQRGTEEEKTVAKRMYPNLK